jgi:hypothetical protein
MRIPAVVVRIEKWSFVRSLISFRKKILIDEVKSKGEVGISESFWLTGGVVGSLFVADSA